MEDEKKINWLSLFIKIVIAFAFILIIVWLVSKLINRNKLSDTFKNNINNMETVAVKYFKDIDLPTKQGESIKVTLGEMIEKELIVSVKTSEGGKCDTKDSYSKITRKKDNYEVETRLECGKEKNTITRKFSFNDCKNCTTDTKNNNTKNNDTKNNNTDGNNSTNNSNKSTGVTYYEYVKEWTTYTKWMKGNKTGDNIENKYKYYATAEKTYYSLGIINKKDIKDEEYNEFYKDKFNDFSDPMKVIHTSVEGNVSYDALLFIPSQPPMNFYSNDYEKGLQLYSRGVFIMDKASDLIPEHFRFVKGLVDSQDLSLNISREMLQHDRQLKVIADRIEKKIQSELTNMLKKDRETYEKFFKNFGLQLKFGIYQSYGMLKDKLQDLLLFYSGKEEKMITLKEYVENMKEGQTEIYFASGETKEKISHLPQVEAVRDRDYDVLYMMDNVDEFMIQMMRNYDSKAFKNVAQGDLNLDSEEEKKELEKINEDNKSLLESLKEALKDKVVDVKVSNRLKSHPVCLVSDQGVSFEMEKVLNAMPDGQDVKAGRILEINPNHDIFKAIQNVYQNNADKINDYASLLFDQALLIEGLSIEDPVAFSNKICELMIELNK